MAKKKRKRSRPRPSATVSDTGAVSSGQVDGDQVSGDQVSAEEAPGGPAATEPRAPSRPGDGKRPPAPLPGSRLGERLRAPSPFPPIGSALARGAAAVLGSFTLIAVPLLLIGLLWLGLVAAGMEVFPRAMVEALGIPPVGTYFDVIVGASIYGLTSNALVVTIVLTVVRSLIWAVLVGMILERLEYGLITVVGILQGLRALPAVLMVNTLNLVLIVAGNVILPALLGPIGNLVFIAALVGGLYLLAFAPQAAVRLRLPAREAIRRSGRAARMPGPRHVVMVTLYFFLALMLATFVPGGAVVTANPTTATWAFVLAGTVVHLVFLAAFCSQWMAVESQVPEAPPPRARPARQGRPATRSRRSETRRR